jgi:hypothetical protein
VCLGRFNSITLETFTSVFQSRGLEGDDQTKKYMVGALQQVPWATYSKQEYLGYALQAHDAIQFIRSCDETSPRYVGPRIAGPEAVLRAAEFMQLSETAVLSGYCLNEEDIEGSSEISTSERIAHELGIASKKISGTHVAISWLLGVAFGRWWTTREFESKKWHPFQAERALATRFRPKTDILVDDTGLDGDVVFGCSSAAALVGADHRFGIEVGTLTDDFLRKYLRETFFDRHLKHYSRSQRKAPIYWQLATPSASYSVWLYIHAFSKDTLFRVQNDYAAPKLAHEERRLESLTREFRDKATAAQRKQLAVQEAFVEELRAFLEEVKRVASLWNPNLDDGVIINFAPLWRLVPQKKSWQKELKSTWDALCDGKYDWAHLAMHLWPERVIPKCATDRSLAIAHGLEDVFWAEGSDGKWTARKAPASSVEELVRKRTSSAVKAALKSLLDAPAATGNGGRGRGGRRRSAATAEGGGA